jgi:subtilisin family serine protease
MEKQLFLLTLLMLGSAIGSDDKLKISSLLQNSLKIKPNVDILVSMKPETGETLSQVISSFTESSTRGTRATAVYKALSTLAENSQKEILQFLQWDPHVKITSFWISNQIYIQNVSADVVQFLSSFDAISKIEEDEILAMPDDETKVGEIETEKGILAEWGIEKIQAPAAWALAGGNDGAGVRIATIDTGVRLTHQALANNYVGASNYGWYDPYSKSSSPYDDHGHGTHVTGTVAGGFGVGVAPGAKWMACKSLRSDNSGTQAAFISCGQFMTCPTNPQGNNPDCAKAPHVVSNSWMANGAGGGITWFNAVINAWEGAGIIGVFANGNAGPACRTGMSPGDNLKVIAVGATTSSDAMASFSGVGPSSYGDVKPDISGPGQGVRSSHHTSDTAYISMSGTSMATPHVAGLVALMHGYNPNISFDQVKSILGQSADRNLSFGGVTCGGITDSTFPNNHFGHGRINALAAMRMLIQN